MTTKEAFTQMIKTEGIHNVIGITWNHRGQILFNIIHRDIYPSLEKQYRLLQAAGYFVKKELSWEKTKK